ncbi:MAG: DAK2 domain-containing protein [Ruminococcus sp.]|jgi:DAK2 domain fusion protein YloV|nr:DAK2 domain-containing protein [Ruminococcus sp.]
MLTGENLKTAIMAAAVCIKNERHKIDELNVYPVPDGDTGSNMSMTMDAAFAALSALDKKKLTVSEVSALAASSMLRGARGNSGVILSLIFRGLSKGLSGLEKAGAEDIAAAFEIGVQTAYKAVMKPQEGTILTVIKFSAEKAKELAAEPHEAVELWEQVCVTAEETLAKTPEMLPVLKKAGVVDAGGKGLCVILRAMLGILKGEALPKFDSENGNGTSSAKREHLLDNLAFDSEEEINFTYCTEFIVNKTNDKDSRTLRAYLETIGDCVVVVDDDEIIKVHVHTDNPGMAIEKALEFGNFTEPKPKIENMRNQQANKVKETKIKKESDFELAPQDKEYGFVAVCSGIGIENLFKDLGVDTIVKGGQTMNPSTDDILRAVGQTPAKTVFVLPNNKNIIMAAQQTISLSDRKICVLETRTIPQGLSAMLAFEEEKDFADNRLNMTKAFEKTSTGQITHAVRDTVSDNINIKKNDIIALANSKIVLADKDVNRASFRLVKKLINKDTKFITVIYGSDVSEEKAENFYDFLRGKISDKIEITMVSGGQPVYYYIFGIE